VVGKMKCENVCSNRLSNFWESSPIHSSQFVKSESELKSLWALDDADSQATNTKTLG